VASDGAIQTTDDRLTGRIRRLGDGLLDVLLPRVCLVCSSEMRRDQGVLCRGCRARLPRLPSPRCSRCGHPTWGFACRWCALLPPYVRCARSACWERPGTTSQAMVHLMKYAGWPAVVREMADEIGRLDWPDDVRRERTALVPVPLSAVRRRERGFNQSELLAAAVSPLWSVPVWTDAIQRVRNTASQTTLTPMDRARNVAGAFHVPLPVRANLRGAHIIVVDDVVTTAATLNACAAALFDGGARILSYVTFARAPASGDRH
jgi:ComF family protein